MRAEEISSVRDLDSLSRRTLEEDDLVTLLFLGEFKFSLESPTVGLIPLRVSKNFNRLRETLRPAIV